MANELTKKIKDTSADDLMLTGVFRGAFAAISGAGYWVDKNVLGKRLGMKSKTNKDTLLRGALVGGLLSLPLAFYSSTSVLDGAGLGAAFINPSLKGELPPAPKDYIYSSVEGEQPYLILDPKYGL